MPMRRLGNQTFAARTTTMGPRHVGFHPGFVDKNQPLGIELILVFLPTLAAADDVGTILFAGVQAFF
jgi:hypothetical protein